MKLKKLTKGKLYIHYSKNHDCNNSVWLCTEDVTVFKYREEQPYERICGTKECDNCYVGGCARLALFVFNENIADYVKEL